MRIKKFFKKLKSIFIYKLISPCFIKARIFKYKILSTCVNTEGHPVYVGPVLMRGAGSISFKENVSIGVMASPYFYNTYCYIEARHPTSIVTIGKDVYINNNACLISEGEGIFIGSDILIGPNFTIFDSDFHAINPSKRINGTPNTAKVIIEDNVFIGANVTVLKGVSIGKNSVIASNSVVSKSIPANVVAGGNPCKVLKDLQFNL
jgi:acetyltransferase-like isoleucine patch superfamily enzyme